MGYALDASGNLVSTDPWAGARLPVTASGFDPNMGSGLGVGAPGGGFDVNQLQTLGGYRPWAYGLPSDASFGTKLGSWVSGNGAMIGGIANLASQGVQAYLGLQQLSLAKKALQQDWRTTKKNFENSAAAYRTEMNDRITGRYYATEEERQAAMKAAELPNMTLKGG